MPQNQQVLPGRLVNQLGKYLYRNIESAYKFEKTSNQYDVYMTVYYQLPREKQIPERAAEGYNDVHEMNININLATYANKIRVNITEISPEEWTFGSMIFPLEKLQDMKEARNAIYTKVIKELQKRYREYDFIF